MLKDAIEKVLVSEEELKAKVQELGSQITRDYQGKDLLMVSVLKGSVIFMADLMRAIDLPCTIDFMCVSSYGSGTKSSGVVKIIKDLDLDLHGKDLLIVEDILDSGKTLHYITRMLADRGTASIRIATLLDKPERRTAPLTPDYSCFTIPDEFVVGYGLDYDERYRNLPYIGVLKREVYEK
ncbi:MAG TPA: hypoxanthine phosphoribosyltransferase [Candidatus Merdivicinus intestinavium]|nr:hypoxanthine phosphoribosyltransferase [Candidatus Merdivicinus intestinavium]